MIRKFFIVLTILFLIRFDTYFATYGGAIYLTFPIDVPIVDIYYLDYIDMMENIILFYGSRPELEQDSFGYLDNINMFFRDRGFVYHLWVVNNEIVLGNIPKWTVNIWFNATPRFFDYLYRYNSSVRSWYFYNLRFYAGYMTDYAWRPDPFTGAYDHGFVFDTWGARHIHEGYEFYGERPNDDDGYIASLAREYFSNNSVIYRIHYEPLITSPENCPNIFDFANNLIVNRSVVDTIGDSLTLEIVNQIDDNIEVSNVSP